MTVNIRSTIVHKFGVWSMGKLVGLIDADFLKYLVVYDIERMYKRGLDPDTEIPYNTVVQLIENRVQKIFDTTQARTKEYLFLFSGRTRDNYRALIAAVKPYKGNRKYTEKVVNEGSYRNIVEEYIKETYHYCKYDEMEADDLCVMGHNSNTYIYSNDKDLRNSPGIHYDIKEEKFFVVSDSEGFTALMAQAMQGDTVDNIAGVDGVGKVGASKLVKGIHGKTLVDKVIHTFIDKYGVKDGLDRFVEMYSLVNLRTARGDWTREKYSAFFYQLDELISKKEEGTLF